MTVTNETLKEYYVKLHGLYESCFNILTAMNQSLQTNASEITVDMVDANGTETTLRIPSFMYLENRLEQLDNNFGNLFKMPDSGDAWFTKSSNMYKLQLVRSSSAPLTPLFNLDDVYAGSTANNILKDLVSPKTYLRLNITNLPENTDQMFMRKIVIFDKVTYDALTNLNLITYEDYAAALYNYNKGEDYEEYDSTIKLPIKRDVYKSQFNIIEIPDSYDEYSTNPWVDTTDGQHSHLTYRLVLDTLEYTDQEDSSIRFTIKVGDYLCLGNEMVVYLVKNVDTTSNTVIIEEQVGHIALQTFEENSQMVLSIYNDRYNLGYVDVPLEENQYIVVFLGVIYNNVRSILSNAYQVDLSTIYMRDEQGNPILDSFGNPMTYMDYYNTYCTNIGDLILGLTQSAYPQISNYNGGQLNSLQNGEDIQKAVSNTLDPEEILQVVPINKHLTDDVSSEEIINLHAQKNDVQAQLATIQDNISQVYNTLTNTDFSQQTSNTMSALQSKLQRYYTERTTLQKQLNSIIDNINSKSLDTSITGNQVKYRIRGLAVVNNLEELVKTTADKKVDIIGMDVEYKYKSTTKDTNSVTVINSSTFTDWNKLYNIDRQRELIFDDNIKSFRLDFVDYKMSDNVIKWNQIDIPIQAGEDVIIRVRYKYNIGQPFVNLYTPWSDELTVTFPPEYRDDVQMSSILDSNRQDTIIAGFRKILLDEGYEEHITNKLVASDQVFFHMPENIYSGFNTPENNLISLKDKLLAMSQDIEQYKSWVEGETNNRFAVYLQYDEQTIELTPNNINKINIYNTDHITGSYIKKNINIIIKNTGDTRVNFYSIFPGNTDVSLIRSNISSFVDNVINYERVPLIIANHLAFQTLGQWIYFRQTNPYTMESIFGYANSDNDERQCLADSQAALNNERFTWLANVPREYLMSGKQVMFGYRNRLGTTESYNAAFNELHGILADFLMYETWDNKHLSQKDNQPKTDINGNIIYWSEADAVAQWKLKESGNYDPEVWNQISKYFSEEELTATQFPMYDDAGELIEDVDEDDNVAYKEAKKHNEDLGLTNKDGEAIVGFLFAVKDDYLVDVEFDGDEPKIDDITKQWIPKKENGSFVRLPIYIVKNDLLNNLSDAINYKLPKLQSSGWASTVYNEFDDDMYRYENTIYEYLDGKSNSANETNRYLMRYSDIIGKNPNTNTYVFLDNKTSITDFLQKYSPQGFSQNADFAGAFLYPDLLSRQTILTDGAADSHIFIDKGEQISIPIVFEYYLDGSKSSTIDHTKVTKSMIFDLRNSLIRDPYHYMIEITGNYDLTASGDIYGNTSIGNMLEDDVTMGS